MIEPAKNAKMAIVLAMGLTLGCSFFAAATESSDLDVWVAEGKWPRGPKTVLPTPAKQLAKGKELEQIGDVRQAAEQFQRLATAYPESDEAEEALILAARNFLAAGNYTECQNQLSELRRRYIHPTYLDVLGQVEVSLGRGFLEGRGEGGTYRLSSRLRKARKIFEQILQEDAQGRWGDDALFGLGQVEEASAGFDEAIKRYKELLEKYPRSELRAEAEGRIAFCINAREPNPDYTESEATEAYRRIQAAQQEASDDSSDLDKAALEENERLLLDRQAQKRFTQAEFYVKNNHFRAAEVYFELIKQKYPNSKWATKADEALKNMRQR